MRIATTLACLLALVLLLPGAASAATTTISGTVYDGAGTDRPAENACVTVYDQVVAGGTDVARVSTGADGTWSADVPAGGPYLVEASCRSEAPTQFFRSAWRAVDATPVAVVAGRATTGVDIHVLPFGSISGTVSSPDGRPPAAGLVCVRANVWRGSDLAPDSAPVPVDAAGRYAVRGLRPGQYHVAASACPGADSDLLPTFAPSTTSFDDASDLAVVPGTTSTDVDIRLIAGTSIRGHVYLGAGTDRPVAGACATALPIDATESHASVTSEPTGPDGAYLVRPLVPLPSGYRVRVEDCSGGTRRFGTTGAGSGAAHPAVGAPTTGYDAHAVTSATLAIDVQDAAGAPITGSRTCLAAFPIPYRLRSDDRGRITLDGLDAGTFDVYISDCADVSDRDDLGRELHITLAAGEQRSIAVRLERGTSVSGSVRGTADGGFGLRGDCVTAARVGGDDPLTILRPTQTTVAADGSYRIGSLTPGAGYRVRFSACADWRHHEGWFDDVAEEALARIVTPTLQAPATGVDADFDVGPRPPVTTLTAQPGTPDGAPDPSFTFTTDVPGARSECRLDEEAWTPCRSPWRAPTRRLGPHEATIRAVNRGVVGAPTDPVHWERGADADVRTSVGEVPAGATFAPDGELAPDEAHPVAVAVRVPRAAHLATTIADRRTADLDAAALGLPAGQALVAPDVVLQAQRPHGSAGFEEALLPALPADPYRVTSTYAAATLSAGVRPTDADVAVSQPGTQAMAVLARCADEPPRAGTCVADRRTLTDGSLRVELLTTRAYVDIALIAAAPVADVLSGPAQDAPPARPTTSTPPTATPTAAPGSATAVMPPTALRVMSARTVAVDRLLRGGLAVSLRAATAGQATVRLLSRRAGRTVTIASGRSAVGTRRRTVRLRASRRSVARLGGGRHVAMTISVRMRTAAGRTTTAQRRITATR